MMHLNRSRFLSRFKTRFNMTKLTMDIRVVDLEPVKNLIELLAAHFDDLPAEIQTAVKDLVDSEDRDDG